MFPSILVPHVQCYVYYETGTINTVISTSWTLLENKYFSKSMIYILTGSSSTNLQAWLFLYDLHFRSSLPELRDEQSLVQTYKIVASEAPTVLCVLSFVSLLKCNKDSKMKQAVKSEKALTRRNGSNEKRLLMEMRPLSCQAVGERHIKLLRQFINHKLLQATELKICFPKTFQCSNYQRNRWQLIVSQVKKNKKQERKQHLWIQGLPN